MNRNRLTETEFAKESNSPSPLFIQTRAGTLQSADIEKARALILKYLHALSDRSGRIVAAGALDFLAGRLVKLAQTPLRSKGELQNKQRHAKQATSTIRRLAAFYGRQHTATGRRLLNLERTLSDTLDGADSRLNIQSHGNHGREREILITLWQEVYRAIRIELNARQALRLYRVVMAAEIEADPKADKTESWAYGVLSGSQTGQIKRRLQEEKEAAQETARQAMAENWQNVQTARKPERERTNAECIAAIRALCDDLGNTELINTIRLAIDTTILENGYE